LRQRQASSFPKSLLAGKWGVSSRLQESDIWFKAGDFVPQLSGVLPEVFHQFEMK
jgi:hypothetical protein